MWEQFKKFRSHLAIALILFAAFIFYSWNLRAKDHANLFERAVLNVMSPLHNIIAYANREVAHVWNDYLFLVHVNKENKLLRDNIKVLNAKIVESREATLANERLKKLLEFKESLPVRSVAATVIGEDSSPWFKTILINRGSDDGLKEGMPVVAAAGVVGQLVKVASSSSRVLLITDNGSGLSAIVQRSRARGVVKGQGKDTCSLEFSLATEDVTVGDSVITSGIGGIFPKGLKIGEVTMVKKGEYGIFQTIEIKPAVNLLRVEEVMVLFQHRLE